jgi:hypothetical protein
VEHTSGNIVLSRSLCYAMLAVLAVVLLVMANGAPGVDFWTSASFAHAGFSTQGFHFSQLLVSIRTSAELLRERLHDTWLFLYVFLGGWSIVLIWGLLERRRLKLRVGRREVLWMGWMSLSVVSIAILYGMGTNGVVARRYPKVVPVSDALALGFVLALPVFAWSRLQRRAAEREAQEPIPIPVPRRPHSTLHLNDDDVIVEPRARFQELYQGRLVPPQEGIALTSSHPPVPDAGAVIAIDRLIETATYSAASQTEAAPAQEPVAAAAPAAPVAAAISSTQTFRENLQALNESWARIERTGMEIGEWLEQQRAEVMARLEKHPGLRKSDAYVSKDFLNEKLAVVDGEWEAIRRAALEITRWFGDAPEANS